MLREVLEGNITPRDIVYLNGLGMKKGKSRFSYMILKTGMEMDKDHTVINCGTPIL